MRTSIGDTVGTIRDHVDTYGWPGGLRQWAGKLYVRKTSSHDGQNVYDREWDILVLLDACRVDLLREVQNEYDFLGQVDTFDSLGSATWEWMPKTFETAPATELSQTAYVCANPFSARFLDEGDFMCLDEVWRYAWDQELGTVRPRPVTDRAISMFRAHSPNRMIVHYMQPHVPFINSSASPGLNLANFGGPDDEVIADDWRLVHRGERTRDAVWADYRDNLRLVMDDVGLLRRNVEAGPFVISSDHGNAAGEFGIYGHPSGVPLPALREVPWVETTATDERTHEPATYEQTEETDVDRRLESLGYTV